MGKARTIQKAFMALFLVIALWGLLSPPAHEYRPGTQVKSLSNPAASAESSGNQPNSGGPRLNRQTISTSSAVTEYQVLTESPVYIRLSDGTLLESTIRRPDAPGQFPIILWLGPYGTGRGIAFDTSAFVKHGYVTVQVSSRGTGCSGGTFDPFSVQEGKDGAEVVEWAATQSWSNGNVGMSGHSYLGIITWFVAAQRPPHLRTIVPVSFFGDIYRDEFYPGGIFRYESAAAWPTAVYIPSSLPVLQRIVERKFEECVVNQPGHAINPTNDFLSWSATHQTDGPDFWERSPVRFAEKIDIPVYMWLTFQDTLIHGLAISDSLSNVPYLCEHRGREKLHKKSIPGQNCKQAKKVLVSSGVHGTANQLFWGHFFDKTLAWFDYWLKGEGTQPMAEPSTTVGFETDLDAKPNFVRTYQQWPPSEGKYSPFFLRAGEALSGEPPSADEAPDSWVYPGATQATKDGLFWRFPPIGSIHYTTEPFDEDTLVVGPAALSLFASSTALDTDFRVIVSEIDNNGNAIYVQKGLLRASHREVVEGRSSAQRPYHSHTNPQLLNPGEIYRFDIEILPIGHAFRAGSRLRLDIAAPTLFSEPHLATPQPARNSVFHTREYPSTLWMPLVPNTEPLPPRRACGMLAGQPCRAPSFLDSLN